MKHDERQFLLTVGWMFLRHGRKLRAKHLFEALVEADCRDGVAVAALSELLLDSGESQRVLELLRMADFPASLSYAEAVLETRALKMSGRRRESESRWRRYLETKKGGARQWIA